jgi:pre-60S factor REI1
VTEQKKREVKALEKRMQKQQRRAEANYQWGNNRQGNFQKHFRDHLLQ